MSDSASLKTALEVQLLPLTRNAVLPKPAPARTRSEVPAGYGVQEQCLPFTAAAALGFLIGSPITFGFCLPGEVPAGAHPFRSPIERPGPDGRFQDARVFYVKDDPERRFIGNAFTFEPIESVGPAVVQPGISFFDRQDQRDLFKLHLPYSWRTPPQVHTLFLPLLNREGPALTVLAGLVETDWYAHPVNLALRIPPAGQALHIAVGEPLAQVIFLTAAQRRPELKVLSAHNRAARDMGKALAEWYQKRAEDRSAYKRLARSRHGRLADSS